MCLPKPSYKPCTVLVSIWSIGEVLSCCLCKSLPLTCLFTIASCCCSLPHIGSTQHLTPLEPETHRSIYTPTMSSPNSDIAPPDSDLAFKFSFVGVTHRSRRCKFQARIYKNNKEYNLGALRAVPRLSAVVSQLSFVLVLVLALVQTHAFFSF